MPFDVQSLGLDQLSTSEKLELVDIILESIPEQVDPIELTDELRAELDRRCAEADADPQAGKPWREVLDRIKSNL